MSRTAPTSNIDELIDVHQVLHWLSRFPINQWWRFAVDGKLQTNEKSWKAFDSREPNSVNAILHGMALAIKHLRKPITLDLIRQLHIQCGTNVNLSKPVKLGDFRNDGVYVQILPEVSTQQGFHDFLRYHPRHNIQGAFLITDAVGTTSMTYQDHPVTVTAAISIPLNHYTQNECLGCVHKIDEGPKFINKEWRIIYYPPHSYPPDLGREVQKIIAKGHCTDGYVLKSIDESLQDVLDTYHDEQKKLGTHQERAKSAMLTTQELARLHPFSDLMNRVIVNCLFFLMELKNGYMPPIFYDPNIFEFTHTDVLLTHCNRGQRATYILIDHPDAEIYGISVTNAAIDPALENGTQAISFALQDELYNAGHQYRHKRPDFALILYQRALDLFLQSGSTAIKNHVAFLYAVGLCYAKLEDNDNLNKTIDQLEALAKKQSPTPKLKEFDTKTYINNYIDKLKKYLPKHDHSTSDSATTTLHK